MFRSSDASKPSSANSKDFRRPPQDTLNSGRAFAWFDQHVVPPLRAFGDAAAMVAIRRALPWSLIGLAVGLVVFFFFAPHAAGGFGAVFEQRIAFALLPAFGLMAIGLVFLLSHELAVQLTISRAGMLISAPAAFFLAPPPGPHHSVIGYLHALGMVGLFLAIAIALLCAGAFVVAKRIAGARFAKPAPFVAGLLIVGVAAALLGEHVSPAQGVLVALHPLATLGDTYGALLAITVVETALWMAGIHGPATLAAIVTPVYLTLQLQNTAAYADHVALPHLVVVSTFLFVFPGGAGATLPLVLLLLFSRAARLRKVAKLTLVPALFNVNEPLLFGLPLVFNPFLCVPFVVAPAVLATITYMAMHNGWVSLPIFYVPSSVPTLASTYLATLDWRAFVLVLANIVVAGVIYFPFVRAYDRHEMSAC